MEFESTLIPCSFELASGWTAADVRTVEDEYPFEWWLGLLLLAPDARGAGLGSRVLREVKRAIAAAGGTAIYLGVLEQNGPGERFWRRHGFAELRRQPYTSATGHPSRVIVMCHRLASV